MVSGAASFLVAFCMFPFALLRYTAHLLLDILCVWPHLHKLPLRILSSSLSSKSSLVSSRLGSAGSRCRRSSSCSRTATAARPYCNRKPGRCVSTTPSGIATRPCAPPGLEIQRREEECQCRCIARWCQQQAIRHRDYNDMTAGSSMRHPNGGAAGNGHSRRDDNALESPLRAPGGAVVPDTGGSQRAELRRAERELVLQERRRL